MTKGLQPGGTEGRAWGYPGKSLHTAGEAPRHTTRPLPPSLLSNTAPRVTGHCGVATWSQASNPGLGSECHGTRCFAFSPAAFEGADGGQRYPLTLWGLSLPICKMGVRKEVETTRILGPPDDPPPCGTWTVSPGCEQRGKVKEGTAQGWGLSSGLDATGCGPWSPRLRNDDIQASVSEREMGATGLGCSIASHATSVRAMHTSFSVCPGPAMSPPPCSRRPDQCSS